MGLLKTNYLNIIYYIVFFISIFSIILIPLFSYYHSSITDEPKISNYSLDINNYSLDKNNKIYLNGQWKFYKNVFIISDNINTENNGNICEIVEIPTLKKKSNYKSFMYGSYEIKLKNIKNTDDLVIFIPNFSGAYSIYLDGQLICKSGNLSKNIDDVSANISRHIYSANIKKKEHYDLVIEIASKKNGGLYMTPVMTSKYNSDKEIYIIIAIFFIMCGICFTCFFLYLIFALKIHNKTSLIFSFEIFLVNLKVLITTEPFWILQNKFSSLSYEHYSIPNYIISLLFLYILTTKLMSNCNIKLYKLRKIFKYYYILVFFTFIFANIDFYNKYLGLLLPLSLFSFPYAVFILIKVKTILNKKSTIYLVINILLISSLFIETIYINGYIKYNMNLIFSICALIYISAIIYFDILKLKQLYINSLKLSIIENKLIEKEIDLLLTQIKPHFLYNTLTTIQSMIKHNPNMAYLLIGNLSTYLKNNMDYINNDHLILFSKEIKHIKTYIAIEKARFGKKINVIYDIQTDDFKVPTLSIQPLVENAIKHGITQKSNGGKIIIRSFQTPNFFIIQIIDDGKGFDTKILENKKHSIGIKNIKFRLKVICNASINITSKIGIGTTVLIKIPKIKRLGVI